MNRELDVKIAKAKGYGVIDKNPELLTRWSSNLRVAWGLVDEMIADGLQVILFGQSDTPWGCNANDDSRCFRVFAKTPQQAICKAYLEWKGRE